MSDMYEAEITGAFTAKIGTWANSPEEALEELKMAHIVPDESELSEIQYDYDVETLDISDVKKV